MNKSITIVIKRLYFNKMGILLLILFIISLLIFYAAFKENDVEFKSILISIASSLLASNIFSVLYALVTNASFLEYFTEMIRNEEKELFNSLILEVQRTNKAYIASKIFDPTQTKNYSFNKDLTSEFSKASKFMFRGVSGKRIAARIFYLNKKLDFIKLIIIHPEDRVSIQKRANHISILEERTLSDIESDIKNDIYISLINLYNSRHKCNLIEIVFQQGYSASRLEILDNAVYVSVYDNDYDGLVYYPSVVKFCNKTVFYKMYATEYMREFEFSKNNGIIAIKSDTTEAQFIDNLIRNNITFVTEQSLSEYQIKYEGLKTEFQSEFNGI